MIRKIRPSQKSTISREFSARLVGLRPEDRVRAVVLIKTNRSETRSKRRQSHLDRKATVAAIRQSAEQVLDDIDSILNRFDGKRLAKAPDALGSLPIETTAAGIKALASSEHVKAILEDQPISLMAGVGH